MRIRLTAEVVRGGYVSPGLRLTVGQTVDVADERAERLLADFPGCFETVGGVVDDEVAMPPTDRLRALAADAEALDAMTAEGLLELIEAADIKLHWRHRRKAKDIVLAKALEALDET